MFTIKPVSLGDGAERGLEQLEAVVRRMTVDVRKLEIEVVDDGRLPVLGL